jgi:hypothetical protein
MEERTRFYSRTLTFAKIMHISTEQLNEIPCEELVKWFRQRKTKILGGKSFPVPLFLLQIPHGLVWDRRRVFALKWWCLTAWSRRGLAKFITFLYYSRRYEESPQDFKGNLTFIGPCIAYIFPSITNNMQLHTIYLFLWNTLHVSGGTPAHHQELKNCIYSIGYLSNQYPTLFIHFLSSWWLADVPPETCREPQKNK